MSTFDVAHNLAATFLWDLPVGRGHTLLSEPSRLVQSLLGDCQRLEEYADARQLLWQLHQVAGLLRVVLGEEPVQAFDSAFGVEPVQAHIPLGVRAVPAGHRVRAADYRHNPVSGCELFDAVAD